MRAARLYSINNVTIGNYNEPRITNESQVKIRVKYCGIGKDDYAMYTGKLNARYTNFGLLTEFSGIILELGKEAQNAGFSVGDKVSATRFVACGNCPMCRSGKPNLCVELSANGSLEEIIVVDCHKVSKLPDCLPLEYGVFFESAAKSIYAIEKMNFKAGETVCILGQDSTALIMLQLLKRLMPSLIVVFGDIMEKQNLSLDLGADKVVSSNWDNLAEATLELTEGFGYDHIVDCYGNAKRVESSINLLSRGGQLTIMPNYSFGTKINIDLAELHWKEARIQTVYEPNYSRSTLNATFMKELNFKPLIGGIFPLNDINKAFELFGTGRYKKILIEI